MIASRSREVLLALLILLFFPSPGSQALASSESQQCQNSTVDLLGEEVAEKSRAFLAKLQGAVSNNDKAKVASMVSYPLLVIHGSRKIRVETKSQFLSRYDDFFDAHVREVIAKQSAKCLFGNYQGTMIGDGEIWYREQANGKMKIVTVNQTAGTESTSH